MNKHDSQEKPFDPRPVQDFVFKMLPPPKLMANIRFNGLQHA